MSVVIAADKYHAKNIVSTAVWLLTFESLDKNAITVLYQYRHY